MVRVPRRGHPVPMTPPRLARALSEGLALVLPADCAGCGAWDTAVCASCRELVSLTPVRSDGDAPVLSLPGDAGAVLPVWSLADYAGPVRGVVVAWKRAGRTDVARVVLDRARRGAQAWAHDPELVLDGAGDVVVMPAPSGIGRRLRGLLVAADLADAVAAGLAASGAVRRGRAGRSVGRAHQSGLGSRARARNRATGVRLLAPPAPEDVVVLVDDVLTTGATLAACARVVGAAGARVAGALVLAAAPPPGRTTLAHLAARASVSRAGRPGGPREPPAAPIRG